jgi:hypothetical protein
MPLPPSGSVVVVAVHDTTANQNGHGTGDGDGSSSGSGSGGGGEIITDDTMVVPSLRVRAVASCTGGGAVAMPAAVAVPVAVAVVGDLTEARLSVSTTAETRAGFAQILRRAKLAQSAVAQ